MPVLQPATEATRSAREFRMFTAMTYPPAMKSEDSLLKYTRSGPKHLPRGPKNSAHGPAHRLRRERGAKVRAKKKKFRKQAKIPAPYRCAAVPRVTFTSSRAVLYHFRHPLTKKLMNIELT